MPYISHADEPWYPYGYVTKDRFTKRDFVKRSDGSYYYTEPYNYARPRLPPAYFTKGYAFYQDAMNSWMKELEEENKDYWARQSKFNHKKLFKPMSFMGEHRIPIYYSYTDFLKKANKYALRKRKAILARIENNRQQAIERRRQIIRARIERNRQQAQRKRKIILARKLNKY